MAVFLVGIVAAMVATQRLRSEGPVASRIAMRSAEEPPYRVCFQTPRDDVFDLAMVDSSGRVVHVLAEDVALEGDSTPDKRSAHCFDWDGIGDDGRPVPPGPYRLYLELERADRGAVSGEKLKITEAAPPPSAESGAEP